MATQVILTAMEGDLQAKKLAFTGQARVVIGRSVGCVLRLDDPTVSRRHCLIEVNGERAEVRDLGSLNGTFVNGEKRPLVPQEACHLHDGDELRLGTHAFRVGLAAVDRLQDGWWAREASCLSDPDWCSQCV